jgi:hypothetical protein
MIHLVPLILTKKAIWDVGICNTHFLGAKKVSMSSVHNKELWVILLIGMIKEIWTQYTLVKIQRLMCKFDKTICVIKLHKMCFFKEYKVLKVV